MNQPSQGAGAVYPPVPDEDDLIGFVTTGNFNLGEGKGSGIGSVLLSKVIASNSAPEGGDSNAGVAWKRESIAAVGKEVRLCIVRDAGQEVGRLARWEVA